MTGMFFTEGGDRIFFTNPKGGSESFPVGKGVDQNFFTFAQGGPYTRNNSDVLVSTRAWLTLYTTELWRSNVKAFEGLENL